MVSHTEFRRDWPQEFLGSGEAPSPGTAAAVSRGKPDVTYHVTEVTEQIVVQLLAWTDFAPTHDLNSGSEDLPANSLQGVCLLSTSTFN